LANFGNQAGATGGLSSAPGNARNSGFRPFIVFLYNSFVSSTTESAGVGSMSPAKGGQTYEDWLAKLEELGIAENALVRDKTTGEIVVIDDDQAIKDFYARAFLEWAEGKVEGTAIEIFDAVTTLLEYD
jgi:hypothetical protein